MLPARTVPSLTVTAYICLCRSGSEATVFSPPHDRYIFILQTTSQVSLNGTMRKNGIMELNKDQPNMHLATHESKPCVSIDPTPPYVPDAYPLNPGRRAGEPP